MGVLGSVAEQSPKEIHRLVYASVVYHRPIAAPSDGTRRLLCPHVLDYNPPGEWRVFCYQCGGKTKSGPPPTGGERIWRCLSLERLSAVKLLVRLWQTERHARQRCVEYIEVDAEDYPGGDPQYGQ